MRTLLVALMCAACLTNAQARGNHAALTWTSSGAALRTTRAASVHWADSPATHTLGHYAVSAAVPTGRSTARMGHVQRLRTCNPFANVRATQPLAPC